ncbi:MAG: isoprenyl transferase [Candidatus Omnitrophica bacterium]|nr:isoprenyl transferase [Candidatus Omnitrophota bacterium]
MDKDNKLPQHIAIIMDGNGRWARKRRLPRLMGHRKGIESAKNIVEACVKLGIKVLTLYTFSTENWKRPKEEVDFLMGMLKDYLTKHKNLFKDYNVRFQVIGHWQELAEDIQRQLVEITENTKNNSGMVLNVALNYGGRMEIVDAVKEIALAVRKGEILAEGIDEKIFSNFLYTQGLPDPDLLIRTAGELRISNFLLWQISYTELYFSKKLWPDFTPRDLERAITVFQQRERRFGGILNKE